MDKTALVQKSHTIRSMMARYNADVFARQAAGQTTTPLDDVIIALSDAVQAIIEELPED